ncbi:hypothetical protein NLI96_g696 [Meripilus lineatus]|uniref:N-acetyltransferase domain-containing protein n=1 Tax=Meripilus lineatus TaxID=2056292 RepID=A0AAD5VG45_9APHY|nr:hypothetical protein NLI96_g696 [Physisporinus lineatus]
MAQPIPFIRRATQADSPALSKICLLTADAGQSGEHLHTMGELPGLMWAEPYVHVPSAVGFVIVDPSITPSPSTNISSSPTPNRFVSEQEHAQMIDKNTHHTAHAAGHTSETASGGDNEKSNEETSKSKAATTYAYARTGSESDGDGDGQGQIVGYILSAFDTRSYENEVEETWFPHLRVKYPNPDHFEFPNPPAHASLNPPSLELPPVVPEITRIPTRMPTTTPRGNAPTDTDSDAIVGGSIETTTKSSNSAPTAQTEETPLAKLTEADINYLRLIHHFPRTDPSILLFSPAHMHINILPAYQNKGWGRRLIGRLVDYLKRDKGLTAIWLGMDMRNDNARRFYEHLGFKPIDIAGVPKHILGLQFQDWM